MTATRQHRLLAYAVALGLAASAPAVRGDTVAVSAGVSAREVFAGEPIIFQIEVTGSQTPGEADLSAVQDFAVEAGGTQNASQTSINMVNGRVTQQVVHRFITQYRLTPRRTGHLAIPSIPVRVGGEVHRTPIIAVLVKQPLQTDRIALELSLSRDRAYVGEPVILRGAWLVGQQIREDWFAFDVPLLASDQFRTADPPADPGTKYMTLSMNGKDVRAWQEQRTLRGQPVTAVVFEKVLIPTRAGTPAAQPATVLCDVVVGYEEDRAAANDPFAAFDSMFGRQRRRAKLQRIAATSNPVQLTVEPLPDAGRPAGFAGHVGAYRLDTTVDFTEVSVGDPLTLTLVLSGPDYLDDAGLPSLQKQEALVRDFKVPNDMADGKVQGKTKVFTQTLRALRPDVTALPAIELPYFDTQARAYRVARSQPIPLTVKAARVVTALDAEGRELPVAAGRKVEAWTRGIAYNYEDAARLLARAGGGPGEWRRSPAWLAALGLPPALFALVAAATIVRRRRDADPARLRARGALAAWRRRQKALAGIADAGALCEPLLGALRDYLGARLDLPAGSLTWRDVAPALERAGAAPATVAELKDVFTALEAGRYGGIGGTPAGALLARSHTLVMKIEAARGGEPAAPRERGRLATGLLALLLPLAADAAMSPERQREVLDEANRAFRRGNELSESQPDQAREQFRTAALAMESLVRQAGVRNGPLYYNIGNCYFRMQDLGRAILNYRHAQFYTPHDPNLLQNLEFARARRQDQFEVPAQARVLRTLFFWHYDVSLGARSRAFILCFVAAWLLGAARLLGLRHAAVHGAIAAAAFLALVLLGSVLTEQAQRAANVPGVILAPDVVGRKGDSTAYEPSFKEPLHAGTEFRLLEARGEWLRVELPDGRTTWLPADSAGLAGDTP